MVAISLVMIVMVVMISNDSIVNKLIISDSNYQLIITNDSNGSNFILMVVQGKKKSVFSFIKIMISFEGQRNK